MSNIINNNKLRDKISGWIVSIETENQNVYTDVIYTKVSREDTILKVIDDLVKSIMNINNEVNIAMFASQDHFIDGATSNAKFTSGSSFNVDLPRDKETYYSLGLGYNFLNKETDTSLMANAFLMQNEDSDMNSNIFSLTFRKLFGEFGKGSIPPVIAKRSDDEEDIFVIDVPEKSEEEIIKEGEQNHLQDLLSFLGNEVYLQKISN